MQRIDNSWAKHNESQSRERVFICDKTHVDFYKTLADRLYIENAFDYTKEGYNLDRFWSYLKFSQFMLYPNIKHSCSYIN